MEEIRIGMIGHGFMGHEHEKMLTETEIGRASCRERV